jgi:hypothetical protein
MIQNTNAMIVVISGGNEMNKITKILFWSATILLGFVNPLISVALVVVYYLPKIISDICQPCNDQNDCEIKSYSDDVLEDMK